VADTPDLPLRPLPELLRWWRSRRVRGVIIGGIAVSLMSRPRDTRDIDALIWLAEAKWPAFLAAGSKYGFEPRLPNAIPFARQSRMLLVRHRATAVDVDITLGGLAFERETLDRATKVRLAGVTVPLETPEDLIVMKAVANRERDLQDIDGLLAAHPNLDVARAPTGRRVLGHPGITGTSGGDRPAAQGAKSARPHQAEARVILRSFHHAISPCPCHRISAIAANSASYANGGAK
jgi:hypothetical protein